mmetsp:Transcript_41017/g.81581  ORF Transcript_41017/g.81581 Transcript_41017/m.81581 type:complete len:105 (-) Transcript_41017:500-814(-)
MHDCVGGILAKNIAWPQDCPVLRYHLASRSILKPEYPLSSYTCQQPMMWKKVKSERILMIIQFMYLRSCIIVDVGVVSLGDGHQAKIVEEARITDTFLYMKFGM